MIEDQHVLRARCRPQGEEPVIRFGEGHTAADRHETQAAVFREGHREHFLELSVGSFPISALPVQCLGRGIVQDLSMGVQSLNPVKPCR